MEFLFKPQGDLDKAKLAQGDLLARTPALRDALARAHRYYADAPDYTHFMVLTQSCDLVRRGKRPPKSRYVTLAAARPLSLVIERHQQRQAEHIEGLPLPVYAADKRILASQLLERLLHNTEDGLFFVRKESVAGVTEDLCVFLPLSVALRAEAHYDACASSKIAELQDVFAAKVGWLTGNIYSRVGTPDLEDTIPEADHYKKSFINEFLAENAIWLTSLQLRWLREHLKAWSKAHPGVMMTVSEAESTLRSVPSPEVILAEQVTKVLSKNNLLAADDVATANNLLANDRVLKGLAKVSMDG